MTPDPFIPALCRTEGHPSWWDDELDGVSETERQRQARHARAKAICRRCPVLRTCDEGFDPALDSGVWAGRLHERRSFPSHGTTGHVGRRNIKRSRPNIKRSSA